MDEAFKGFLIEDTGFFKESNIFTFANNSYWTFGEYIPTSLNIT